MTKSRGLRKYTKRRPLSEEHKNKISDFHKGKKKPGTSKALKGRKRPDISERAKGKKHSIEWRKAISEGQKKFLEKGIHHWQSKWTGENKFRRFSKLEYRLWREKLLELAENKCQDCGSKNRLHVHHIKCFNKFPSLRTSLENGKVLCQSCHSKLHKKIQLEAKNVSK